MAPRNHSGRLPRPFGPYQLLRRIAFGGMAEVYVALAQGVGGFEKLVAIKLIHPGYSDDEQFVRMLVDEAKLSVLLTHSNIAQTFDLGTIDGRFFIVMEYVDGVDAAKLQKRMLAAGERMPIAAALFIVSRICHALDYAHRKTDVSGRSLDVIHRDVSPHNVLLGVEGDVKLTDFGIAKAALSTSETEVGVIKGKYCYMSPEQAWADPIDQRSDIYSTGAVLYEFLTGRMLVEADENLPALLERVRRAEHVPARVLRPEIPPGVETILEKALAPKAADRYETAGDLAIALEHALFAVDRTFNQSKLERLMAEYVPPASFGEPVTTIPEVETNITKLEGGHSKMVGPDFQRGSGTSMIFTERSTDVADRTLKSQAFPAAERPKEEADEEDEATTFFSREAFASGTVDVEEESDSTLIDTSGDLAARLEEMVSLGGARPIKLVPSDRPPAAAMPTSFRPPKPLWEPLPFVGPSLEPSEVALPQASESPGLSRAARAALVVSALVITFALVAMMLR